MRRFFLAASFAFWAVMMALLFQRHSAVRRAEMAAPLLALVRRAPSSPARYLLSSGGRPVGHATVFADADVVADAVAYRLTLAARLALPEEVAIDGEAVVRDPGGLAGFAVTLRAGASLLRLRGEVSAGELRIERAGDVRGGVRIPLPAAGEAGVTVREAGEVAARAAGTVVPARRYMVATQAGGVELWVDGRGELLRLDVPSWRFRAVREGVGDGGG